MDLLGDLDGGENQGAAPHDDWPIMDMFDNLGRADRGDQDRSRSRELRVPRRGAEAVPVYDLDDGDLEEVDMSGNLTGMLEDMLVQENILVQDQYVRSVGDDVEMWKQMAENLEAQAVHEEQVQGRQVQ